ncbi:MAG TPA: DUF481 domain-containing protein [Thermoanaerobaculia bacterium]|nr:DUF481 domain-containing protein [Thermoanaerobaculia bacterium]
MLLSLFSCACLSAQETPVPAPAPSWHETRFSLGFNSYSGDSSSISFSTRLNSKAVKDRRESELDVEGDFSKSGGRTFVDREWVEWAVRDRFSADRRVYAMVHTWIEHNQTSGIDFRGTVGPGVGTYVIDRDREKFMIEGGLAICREIQTQNSTFPLIYFDPQLQLAVTPQSWLQTYLEARANLEDHNDVRLYSETSFNTQITQRIGIQIGGRIDFDNQPVRRHKKTVIQTYTMVSLSFGGRPR